MVENSFATTFPSGLTVGCPAISSGGNYLKLTTAYAVDAFLPNSGTSNILSGNFTNPTNPQGTGRTFSGQLVAATLSVGFDNAIANFSACTSHLSDLCFATHNSADPAYYCEGYTVAQVISASNYVLGGNCVSACPTGLTALCAYSPTRLSNCLDAFNTNYDNGNTNLGKFSLTCPSKPVFSSDDIDVWYPVEDMPTEAPTPAPTTAEPTTEAPTPAP